jgi:uncharacterized protein (TIGR02466 family)
MNYKVIPLFSTPLYTSVLNTTQEELDFIKQVEFKRVPADNGDQSVNIHILDHPKLVNLKKQIYNHLKNLTTNALCLTTAVTFNLQNSWVMRHKKGDWSHEHNHANSIFSGILYIETDEQSGEIVFLKGNHLNLFPSALNIPVTNYNEINSSMWEITPTSGQLILFPSHLTHRVSPSKSDNLRYCIAFNLFPNGILNQEMAELEVHSK